MDLAAIETKNIFFLGGKVLRLASSGRRVFTIQSSCSASACLGEEAFMESSQDPMTAAPRSTCAASFLHESPPVLGGGNEKCRAAAAAAAAAAATTASSGPSTTPCFVMVS